MPQERSAGHTPPPPSIMNGRHDRTIGKRVIYYPEISSTADEGRRLALEGAEEGLAIITGEQKAGRGRMGRKWLCGPDSSLTFSVVLHPSLAQLPQINMIGSLATLRAIKKETGIEAAIKWPNDVLINGRKVSGVLVESIFEGSHLRATILSIGLNVNLNVGEFPEIASFATSLSNETGAKLERWDILATLLKEIEGLYLQLRSGQPVYEEWLAHVETVGKTVRVKTGDHFEEGLAEAIAPDGSITLRRHDGSLVSLATGE